MAMTWFSLLFSLLICKQKKTHTHSRTDFPSFSSNQPNRVLSLQHSYYYYSYYYWRCRWLRFAVLVLVLVCAAGGGGGGGGGGGLVVVVLVLYVVVLDRKERVLLAVVHVVAVRFSPSVVFSPSWPPAMTRGRGPGRAWVLRPLGVALHLLLTLLQMLSVIVDSTSGLYP